MEHNVSIRFLLLLLGVWCLVFLVCVIGGALIGTSLEDPSGASFFISILALCVASVSTGAVSALFASSNAVVCALVSSLFASVLLLVFAIATPQTDQGGLHFSLLLIPSMLSSISAFLFLPKNSSKRRLKKLGVKV